MLSIRNLHKSFGKQQVLRGLSLDVDENGITVIIGGSGQGKSVLLKHLVGLLSPDEGGVYINGKPLHHMNTNELREARKHFGLLFQDAALFDSMDVYDNISFPLREHTDYDEEKIALIVKRKLEQIRLPGIEDKMPSELSGGMRKRVGLARATVLNPRIILYDEPTTGLDPVTTRAIDDLIVDTQNDLKGTSLIISHDIPSSLRIANTIAMLHDGRIVAKGTPEEFLAHENPVVQEFLKPVVGLQNMRPKA